MYKYFNTFPITVIRIRVVCIMQMKIVLNVLNDTQKNIDALCKIHFELWRIHKNMNKVLSDSLYDCLWIILCFHDSDLIFPFCLCLSARSQRMLYEGHWISKTHTHTHLLLLQRWWKQNQAIGISRYRHTSNLITLWTVQSDTAKASGRSWRDTHSNQVWYKAKTKSTDLK